MGVSRAEVESIFTKPFMDLVFDAQRVHRQHHDPNKVQWATLLSVKTGACPEDCGYCAQSAHFKTGLVREKLMSREKVAEEAAKARANGATRFCMGAAWRRVADSDMPALEGMIRDVKALGMETCVTLGTITEDQAASLAKAGLDYYNHNLDTSREHYGNVVTTRSYDERLGTLAAVRQAGIGVCCGGIAGLGETRADRIGLLCELANLPSPPESVPINRLVPIAGTPLEHAEPVDDLEIVRMVATARILMPASTIRLSAGRETMSEAVQTLCFLAGANSLFTGDKLLTTKNPAFEEDRRLLDKLGMSPATLHAQEDASQPDDVGITFEGAADGCDAGACRFDPL
jgi:biotin synthase